MRHFRHIAQLDIEPVLPRLRLQRFDQPHTNDLTGPGLKHKAVVLRGHDDWSLENFMEIRPQRDEAIFAQWRAMQELIAAAQSAIASDAVMGPLVDATQLCHVVLSIIEPNSFVQWHIDGGEYTTATRRFHIPLDGTEGSINYAPREQLHMKPGELTWLDNRSLHSAGNWSDAYRTHAIFELPCR